MENFLGERLIVDMLPFSKQVLICCDSAPRRGGHRQPERAAGARGRSRPWRTCAPTSPGPSSIWRQAGRRLQPVCERPLPLLGRWQGMDGHTCVHEYGIPNFYFHLTMTLPCCARPGWIWAKRDYLGGLNLQ